MEVISISDYSSFDPAFADINSNKSNNISNKVKDKLQFSVDGNNAR